MMPHDGARPACESIGPATSPNADALLPHSLMAAAFTHLRREVASFSPPRVGGAGGGVRARHRGPVDTPACVTKAHRGRPNPSPGLSHTRRGEGSHSIAEMCERGSLQRRRRMFLRMRLPCRAARLTVIECPSPSPSQPCAPRSAASCSPWWARCMTPCVVQGPLHRALAQRDGPQGAQPAEAPQRHRGPRPRRHAAPAAAAPRRGHAQGIAAQAEPVADPLRVAGPHDVGGRLLHGAAGPERRPSPGPPPGRAKPTLPGPSRPETPPRGFGSRRSAPDPCGPGCAAAWPCAGCRRSGRRGGP